MRNICVATNRPTHVVTFSRKQCRPSCTLREINRPHCTWGILYRYLSICLPAWCLLPSMPLSLSVWFLTVQLPVYGCQPIAPSFYTIPPELSMTSGIQWPQLCSNLIVAKRRELGWVVTGHDHTASIQMSRVSWICAQKWKKNQKNSNHELE